MKTKKFIESIKEYLGLEELEIKSKRKSVKVLLEKLKHRHEALISKKHILYLLWI